MDHLLGLLQAHPLERPKYQALYRLLRDFILSSQIGTGQQLPPSRKLAQHLKVGRNTVLQAYDLLLADGLIDNRQGAGLFVHGGDVNLLRHVGIETALEAKQAKSLRISQRAQKLESFLKKRRRVSYANRPFALAGPSSDLFDFTAWARVTSKIWRTQGTLLAHHYDPAGYAPFREKVAEFLQKSRGVRCHADQVMIVAGAQQGLDILSRLLWDQGDCIALEDPTFSGVQGIFRTAGLDTIALPVDEDGVDVRALRDPIHKISVRGIVVTPSRNYPLGPSLSLHRRLDVLDVARTQGAWIIEDDFDCDFRFHGPPLSALQSMDQSGQVIYVGSFGRVMFPALRLGYVVVPERLRSAFLSMRAVMDYQPSIVSQAAMHQFMQDGYFNRHIRKMRKLYGQRRAVLMDLLEQQCADYLKGVPADGGLHICMTFRQQDKNDNDFIVALADHSIAATALSPFYHSAERRQQGVILGTTGGTLSDIEKAVHTLKEVCRAFFA